MPLTFTGLSFEDLQVAVGHLQPLTDHDLVLEVTQGDVVTMKRDHVVAQLGGELVVDTRHGSRVTALPLLPGHTLAARPDLAGGLRQLCLEVLPRGHRTNLLQLPELCADKGPSAGHPPTAL